MIKPSSTRERKTVYAALRAEVERLTAENQQLRDAWKSERDRADKATNTIRNHERDIECLSKEISELNGKVFELKDESYRLEKTVIRLAMRLECSP